nr:glycoside hydrolase family 20 zincin-like fold domain-containing protein [Candidatus Sigynarchaeota archaeon]
MTHVFTIKNLSTNSGHWSGNPAQFIPVPRVIDITRGTFSFAESLDIESSLLDDNIYIATFFSEELARRLRSTTFPLKLGKVPPADGDVCPANRKKSIPADQEYLFKKEGYYLEIVAGKATILAETPRGIFYGLTTLLQLAGTSTTVPACAVLDWPSMEIRGVSDENARGQAGSVEGLKRYCRYIALLKMNTFQMNLEDMFRSKKHPKSSDDERGCYSMEELRELSEYAAKFFVEVTPIQSTCGHLDNLFYLPEYKHLAEYENVAMCYDISNPKIYDFIKDIVEEEVDSWYLSPSFHMACDESYDIGKGRSQKMVIEKGIGKAYLDHYTRCYEIIKAALEKRHGAGNSRIFIYHDILIHHPAVLEGLPRKNLVIDVWKYTPSEKYPEIDKIIENGFEFIVSPSVMDYQRVYPSLAKSEKNIINMILYGFNKAKEAGAPHIFKGQINTTWGDFRSENERDLRMYGYALCASVSWNISPWLLFENNVHAVYPALRAFKVGFYKHVFGIADELKAARLDEIVHGIEGGKAFKPWFTHIFVFPKLWTHPLQQLKKDRSRKYPIAIESFLKGMELCDELKGSCTDHDFYFDAVKLALKLHVIYCKKMLLGYKLWKVNPIKLKPKARKRIAWHVDEMLKYFATAKGEYKTVWEINNKPAGYGFLLDQYDNMIRFYTAIKEAIQNSTSFPRTSIPSEFIYTDYRTKFDIPVHFKKAIKIDKIPISAHLQAFAMNHAAITINGTEIGWIQYRATLSYMILNNCVKTWDVTSAIKQGENQIEVAIVNNIDGWSALNFLLELKFPDGTTRYVVSDASWTCDTGAGGETGIGPAKSFGSPPSVVGNLTMPDFAKGIRSHYTRFFGATLEFAPRIPKLLLPLVIAIAKKAKVTT